jgi:hypothetical protein
VLRRSVENLGLGANSYFSHLIQWNAVFFGGAAKLEHRGTLSDRV